MELLENKGFLLLPTLPGKYRNHAEPLAVGQPGGSTVMVIAQYTMVSWCPGRRS